MSKSIEKHSTKTLEIPAHAKEIDVTTNFLERAVNTGAITLLNFPSWVPLVSDASFTMGGSIAGIVGSMLVAFTIPQMSGKGMDIKTTKEALNERLSKVPLFHLFANHTFQSKSEGKDVIVKMKRGKAFIYDITQPNPKDLWDKMYESETGHSPENDFILLYS